MTAGLAWGFTAFAMQLDTRRLITNSGILFIIGRFKGTAEDFFFGSVDVYR